MMKKMLEKALVFVTAVMLVIPGGVAGSLEAETSEDFDQFLFEEWKDAMESDYLSMHFGVIDYQAYGIEKPEPTLGHVSYQEYYDGSEELKETLKKLESFDVGQLDERQKVDYETLHFYLENAILRYQYPQFDELFNPYSGDLMNLVTNYTEFVLRNEEDVQDYLTILKDTPRYVDEMLEMTYQQASEGFFMNDDTIDVALENIDEFTEKKEDSALIIIFEKNLDALDGISAAKKEEYKQQNRDIVLNEYLPSYEKARNQLASLKGSRKNSGGTSGYPNGKEYYEAMAQYKGSTNQSVEEMVAECERALESAYLLYITTLYSIGFDESGNFKDVQDMSLSEPEEILEYLRNHLDRFPEGPEVEYTPSYLDPSVANPSTVAYYMSPPIDDITQNVIRINGDIVGEDNNSLYYTLAHEGFPGHLYQFTWYYNTQPNPIRGELSIMGYQEGWAQYVEGIMLEESELDEYSATDTRLNVFLGYVLNAWADLGVNGLGWSQQELKTKLDDMGFNGGSAGSLCDAVVGMPATIVPYGYGMLKFYDLRDKAQEALGEDFNEVDFHTVLLTNGPRPFDLVEQDVNRFIESQGREVPTTYSAFHYDQEQLGDAEIPGTVMSNYLKKGAIILAVLLLGLIALIVFLVKRHKKKKQEVEKQRLIEEHIRTRVEEKSLEQIQRLQGTYGKDKEENQE